MTDLIERLRDDARGGGSDAHEAAAEIERLKAENEEQQAELHLLLDERKGWLAEIERLTAALGPSAAEAWAHMYDETVRLQAEVERLRALLEPFAETARRLGWDKLDEDDMDLGNHVIESPADDIAPGAAYCLMIGAFRAAALADVQTPVMQAASEAAARVDGWSDAKKEYAERVVKSGGHVQRCDIPCWRNSPTGSAACTCVQSARPAWYRLRGTTSTGNEFHTLASATSMANAIADLKQEHPEWMVTYCECVVDPKSQDDSK